MIDKIRIPIDKPIGPGIGKYLELDLPRLILIKTFFEDEKPQEFLNNNDYDGLFLLWESYVATNSQMLVVLPWFLLYAGIDFRENFDSYLVFPKIFPYGEMSVIKLFDESWLEEDRRRPKIPW